MITRVLDELCLSALGSPALGWAVRTVIVLASRNASPRGEAVYGRAGTMVTAR
ncbi:hypothetical protein GOFOIKOB_4831 [Methylobacterium tardum]|jgi:hypothetical protein|nr:hypothetical protein GOFOIKOB_4831 [Methylobacterium tardum]